MQTLYLAKVCVRGIFYGIAGYFYAGCDERKVFPVLNGERVKNLSNEEVQQYVDKVVQKCECLKAGEFTFAATGDTMVIGLKFEDETDIIVAKDYYEDAIMDED